MSQLMNNIDDALRTAQREIRRLKDENEELREEKRQSHLLLASRLIPVPMVWNLTNLETTAFRYLASREQATIEGMMSALYSHRASDWPGNKICTVIIHKMRKKLRPFGVQIFTNWGMGWTIGDRVALVTRLFDQHGPLVNGLTDKELLDPARVMHQYLRDITTGQRFDDRADVLLRVLFAECVKDAKQDMGAAINRYAATTGAYWEGLASTYFDVTGERLERPATA